MIAPDRSADPSGSADRRRLPWADLARTAAVVGFVALGLTRSTDLTSLLMRTSLWAIAALGVGLVLGLAGQPALCQGAFMLVGAYAYVLATRPEDPGVTSLLGVAAAIVAGLVVALLVSPVLRARGYTFALATIALDLFIRQAFRTGDWLPGQEAGLPGVVPLHLFGRDLYDPADYLRIGVAILVVALVVLHLRYGRGRRARALRAVAQDPDLLAHLGQDPAVAKRAMFVLSGGLGALSGALIVASFGFVQPTTFTVRDSFALAVAVVIGGRDRLLGAVLGAVIYQLSGPVLGPSLAAYQPVLLGAIVIAAVRWFPDGLLPRTPRWFEDRRWRSTGVPDDPSPATDDDRSPGASLATAGLVQDFGALRALDHVDLRVDAGSVTALVGPNGAGKSTLLSAIAGTAPAAGTIHLDDRDITGRPAFVVARAGVISSQQRPRLVERSTVVDNVLLGVDLDARRGTTRDEAGRRCQALACLDALGIAALARRRADQLPAVERRLVDLARVLAARPRLALLDEPSAGLDPSERDEVVRAVATLHEAGTTVIVVEHDLELVRQVASEVVALVDGRVLAVGTGDEVMALPAFVDAYLGRGIPA